MFIHLLNKSIIIIIIIIKNKQTNKTLPRETSVKDYCAFSTSTIKNEHREFFLAQKKNSKPIYTLSTLSHSTILLLVWSVGVKYLVKFALLEFKRGKGYGLLSYQW